jgi:hypothetical protein
MFKALDLWLPAYLRRRRRPRVEGVTDVMLCVCDHFEPLHATDKTGALARVARWQSELPRLTAGFRDSDGQPPRHTFFYPIEQYDPDLLRELAALCAATGAETEIHLHHDRDTADHLRRTLERGKELLAGHGLLARAADGSVRYGFIHGNWALDDSDPAGRNCGVRNELEVLAATGCYADFTMPSAPHPTQTRIINSLYRAQDTPAPKSHDHGDPVRVRPEGEAAPVPANDASLLLVQGPLGLNWRWRKWGVLPRIENGDLTAANPPTPARLRVWLDLGMHVLGRPEWMFIKLHTHGALPENSAMLLGEPMRHFHDHLKSVCTEGRKFRLHYVTARELVNILHAAEDGKTGNAGSFRDYRWQKG